MKNVYKKLYEFRKLTGKVAKSSNNPFFKTKYADLNSVIEATDFALEEVGLVYVDRVEAMNLVSEIWDYDSGEFIQATIPLILSKNDMQQLGGAITYARRYNRMALLGLMAVDDDGNQVSGRETAQKPVKVQVINAKQVKLIQTLISKKKIDADTVSMLKSHYNIESWNDLPAASMQGLVDWFEKKPDIIVE